MSCASRDIFLPLQTVPCRGWLPRSAPDAFILKYLEENVCQKSALSEFDLKLI